MISYLHYGWLVGLLLEQLQQQKYVKSKKTEDELSPSPRPPSRKRVKASSSVMGRASSHPFSRRPFVSRTFMHSLRWRVAAPRCPTTSNAMLPPHTNLIHFHRLACERVREGSPAPNCGARCSFLPRLRISVDSCQHISKGRGNLCASEERFISSSPPLNPFYTKLVKLWLAPAFEPY